MEVTTVLKLQKPSSYCSVTDSIKIMKCMISYAYVYRLQDV